MKVGIQLYSVKQYMAKDPLAAIRQVVGTGYRYLEGANHTADKDFGIGFGADMGEVANVLKETGGSMISCHLSPVNMDSIDQILEAQGKVGTKFIVDPADFFPTKDAVLRKAEACNKLGEKCKAAGMGFLYHNHFHEFHEFDGETVMDLLLKNTDPALVGIELDTYWVMRGGENPVEFIKKYGDRIALIHQKDYPKGKEADINFLKKIEDAGDALNMESFMKYMDGNFTEIGTGIMPIQDILNAAASNSKCEFVVLEQDATTLDEMESIKVSMEHFKKFEGLEW